LSHELLLLYLGDKKPTKPEDDFKFTKDGKLIIGEGGDSDDSDDSDLIEDEDEGMTITARRKQTSAASTASSWKTSRTQKSSITTKSGARKRKGTDTKSSRKGARSERSVRTKSKKFKSSSSVASSGKYRK
jgi:hypothetical protein